MDGWILAIDFGTSFTTAAIASNGDVKLVEVDGSWRIPSIVLADDSGHLVVGRAAERQAAMTPERAELTPKRHLGEPAPLLLGDQVVPVAKAVGAVLRTVAAEAVRLQGGRPPAEVRLTHPATWQESRLSALADAAWDAGLGGR